MQCIADNFEDCNSALSRSRSNVVFLIHLVLATQVYSFFHQMIITYCYNFCAPNISDDGRIGRNCRSFRLSHNDRGQDQDRLLLRLHFEGVIEFEKNCVQQLTLNET